MGIVHVKSVTIADGTNSNIVRPGDWNSGHNLLFTLSGNTTLSSTASGQNVILAASGGLSIFASEGSKIYLSSPVYANSDHSHGDPTLNLTNLSGTTASASNGFTLSLSAAGPATASAWGAPSFLDAEHLAAQQGNASIWFQPMQIDYPVQMNHLIYPVNFSNASNSSNSATCSIAFGIFTMNGATLSGITNATGSTALAITGNGTVGSYSLWAGKRHVSIPLTTTLTPGFYYIGFWSRSTTGGGAGMTFSNFVASNMNSALSGPWGSANNASYQHVVGLGSFSNTSATLVGSAALTDLRGSAAVGLRQMIFYVSST